ncbi:hypothetical protein BDSB_03510 [Burkholderia dolosa PC543]|nr:hypothetical protein BDSB_03510 [Burkholderia dolosa PC543]
MRERAGPDRRHEILRAAVIRTPAAQRMRDRFVGLAIRLGAQSHEQLRNRHAYRALASRNTMFLHLHTSVTAMLRRHISIDVARMSGQDAQASEQLLLQHRAVRRGLRPPARSGAHRDARAYRLRARPFRARRRYIGNWLGGFGPTPACRPAAAGAASPRRRNACRAIDRFVGRPLESAQTARQPRAAASANPLIRLSR